MQINTLSYHIFIQICLHIGCMCFSFYCIVRVLIMVIIDAGIVLFIISILFYCNYCLLRCNIAVLFSVLYRVRVIFKYMFFYVLQTYLNESVYVGKLC